MRFFAERVNGAITVVELKPAKSRGSSERDCFSRARMYSYLQ